MQYLSLLAVLLLFLNACSGDVEKDNDTDSATVTQSPAPPLKPGCKSCHKLTLDPAHDIGCTVCHNGRNDTSDKNVAHSGMLSQPAHPDTMGDVCGQCHAKQVSDVSHSNHFSLKKEVNLVRAAFGAVTEIDSLLEIPVQPTPDTVLELADDMLRRRCLRCHPYFSGDRYPAIVRGTGCASCHLGFYNGKLISHTFFKTPGDDQCLQCHYGNWVGFDYYGRYEQDLNDEYRTPYTTRYDYFRPFGVEFHNLTPDIHQQKGMVCVDCHRGAELMGQGAAKIRCEDCHSPEPSERRIALLNITKDDQGNLKLLSAGDGKLHLIPTMQHPAHAKYGKIAACQVCHAQWSFGDNGTHLMRNDLDEYDDFAKLSVQGSFEVERIIKNNLDYDAEELPHRMTDKISGQSRVGLWYKGYTTRRWENVTIGRDEAGRLQVMRPILKLALSWIDADEEVHFDSVRSVAPDDGFLPYVPHTTGKAGMFYSDRIEQFLKSEVKADR